ncbi:facilitated trehalose transporter Tret1 [Helicoverpa armigera]|uniref:facilitated trehalose transporter Tret1 n=1 Tax=Helicoverpa armigera TaxID=29058 RepID=UPI003083A6DC
MCGGDLYFWRQAFILTTGLFYSASVGIMLAYPSVLSPALVSSNGTDIKASSEQASWIAASNGFAGLFGFFILSPILQTFGRKIVHISCNLLLLIGWMIFPLANSIPLLYAARIVQGLAIGGIYINSMIICEYVDSKRRGYFLTLKKVSIAVGTLICHSMSLYWDWRQIATFAIIPPTVAVILTFFWPESPSFLAMKGRFEECEESFIWLNGPTNLRELHHLQLSQMETVKPGHSEKHYKFLFRKEFIKPLVIVSLLTLLLDLCGRYYFVVYVIQIMVELIGDKTLAVYCTLGADCLTIVALASSCFIISCFKRRAILFTFGSFTVSLMLLICLLMILKSFGIGTNLFWLTPSLIILQNFVVNVSLIPVSFALIGEVFPLEYKGTGSCISGVVFTLLYTLTLKLTPLLIDSIGVGGTYGVYGFSVCGCLVLLYFVVPETKDKTLQQIEDGIKGVKRAKCEFETDTLL